MNSILDLLRRPAGRAADIAFEAPGRRPLRYEELQRVVEHGARCLASAGVGSGDRVAIVLPDGPELAGTFLAATACGVAAPLNPALTAREFQQHLERLRPRCLVLEAGRPSAARDVARELALPIVELRVDTEAPAGVVSWSVGASAVAPTVASGDLAIVLATSGTTARPKIVGLTHANLLATARQVSSGLELTPEDRALSMVPLFHGSGLFNVLLPSLAAGARIVLAPAFLAPQFFAWLESHRPSWYQGAPAMHQALLTRAAGQARVLEAAPLRFIRSSSAPLPPSVLKSLESVFRAPVVEGYGMTEANQIACNPLPPRARKPGTVGLPTGTEVALRDGEVVLRGPNVMAGYLDDPAANAAAFVDGWFRTGDVGHLDADGYLCLTGRLKELINRGGEKIAPREVDEALLEHAAVAEAMTFSMPHASLGEDVAAAVRVVPGAAASEQELREHVAARLAPFKVPARVAFVDAIPRGPTGKPQRVGAWERLGLVASTAPTPGAARAIEPPESETEALVARLWAEVLGLDAVGRRESFLDLGGDSVLAGRIALRLSSALGIDVPLVALFTTPTVASMAALAERCGRSPRLRPARRGLAHAPCSSAQRQLWLFEELGPEVSPYVHTEAVRLSGPVRAERMREALEALVARHEILRTTYEPGAAGPTQRVQPPRPFELRTADAGGSAEPAAAASAFIEALGREPFDLAADRPLRAALVRLGDEDHVLALATHHVALDAWSLRTLFAELEALYAAPGAALPELPLQYGDFAAWKAAWVEDEVLPRQLEYWKQALGGAVEDAELPGDRPRPALQSHRGAARQRVLPVALSDALARFSRESGVSLFTTLLTGFAALLHRQCGATRLRIGAPVAGRPIAEALPLIGIFTNLLVLQSDAAGDPSFADALRRMRDGVLGALAHQDVPFERLVEALRPPRRLSHNPLFQVAFNWREYEPLRFAPEGVRSQPWPARLYASRFDLTLYGQLEAGRVAFTAEYASDLFDPETVEAWLSQLETLLAAAVERPSLRLSELPLFDAGERSRQLALGQGPSAPFRSEATLSELFRETAARRPSATALVAEGERLTYGTLAARVDACAASLVAAGVGPGAVVGIAFERSLDGVVAGLAALASGATALPLDPGYPEARLRFLVEDSGARVVLAPARPAWLTDPGVVVLDPRAAAPATPSGTQTLAAPDAAAWLLYTSGSSGPPKGVLVSHRSFVNRLEWMARAYPWSDDDVACLKTSVGFVDAVAELWGPLLAGVPTVILGLDDARDPRRLAAALAAHGVTRLIAVPSLLEALLEVPDASRQLAALRLCVSSGEPLGADLARRLLRSLPRMRLLNLYGSTEVAADATAFEVAAASLDGTRVSVGRPIANLQAYVLDARREPVAAGVAGELWIGGPGVALGYHRRPELTAERFWPDPFSAEGGRLFRTGDLAAQRRDGTLDLLGRVDDQLKVRGVRIEPAEVEAVLREHPAVLEAAVGRVGDGAAAVLAAWVVPRPDAIPDASAILDHARLRLPLHSVPNVLEAVTRLPRTTSGKLDRRGLRRGSAAPPTALERTPPLTPTEESLAAAWSPLLGIEVWREADFFAIGGHSLSAVRMVAAVNRLAPRAIALKDVFAHPRLVDLARFIDASGPGAARAAAPLPASTAATAPLAFGQEALWFLGQLYPGSPAFNLGIAADLPGPFDAACWDAALRGLVARHGALRSVFRRTPEGLEQVVAADAVVETLVEDETRGDDAASFAGRLTRAPFDFGAPLFRAGRIALADGRQRLVLAAHHAIADGWSLGLLARDLGAAYRAAVARGPLPGATRCDALAFARWQRDVTRTEALEAERAYWRERLAGPLPPQDLPADRPRPRHRELRGARVAARWPKRVAQRVQAMAAAEHATPFMVLLTAFKRLVRRELGQDDVRVATFVAGRERREFDDVVGCFVNTLVLRTRLAGAATFRECLGRVSETVRGALAHSSLPFEQVLAEAAAPRDPRRPALAQAGFVLQSMPWPAADFGGHAALFASVDNGGSGLDLTLYLRESADGLGAVLEYDTALFDAPRMERLLAAFGSGLEAALDAPDARDDAAVLATAATSEPVAAVEAGAHDPALEAALLAIWREVLNQPELSADTSFFDAGGHSLLSVALFDRIEARLGRRLPIAALFDAPSVAAFARAFESAAARPSSGLYAVQARGSKPPLFYVPSRFFLHRDAVNVVGLAALARELGPEQPLYSFCVERAQDALEARVDELAEAFVDELRAVQPRGPYFLVGTSSGGYVTCDMAQLLRARGETVALLGLLDTYAPGYPRRTRWSEAGFWTARARRALAYGSKLLRLGWRAPRALLKRVREGPEPLPLTLRRSPRTAWRPSPVAGRLVLFRSSVQERFDLWGHCYDDPHNGWGRYASDVDRRDVPGPHDAMLSGEALTVLGRELRQRLAAGISADAARASGS